LQFALLVQVTVPLEQGVDVGFPQAFVRPYQATFFLAGGTFIRSIRQEHHLAAIGAGLVGSAALNAAGRNPEKVGELRTMMILGISFIDALAIIGFVAAIVGKVM
jgi:F-type H+-transporting ATPase subunit c